MTAAGLHIAEHRHSALAVRQAAIPDDAIRYPTRLLDYQYLRLLLSQPRDSVAICLAVQFRGAFDPGVAQSTWGELIDRHPGLRLCLELPKHAMAIGQGRASILENVRPPAMTLEDLRGLTADAQEMRVRREFHRLSHVEWQFDQWPLHHFSLLCVGDDQLHVYFAADHAIADALGEILVLGEFIEIYTARLAGRAPRLAPAISAAEYDDLLARIGRYQPTAEELALVRDELERQPDQSRKCLWNPNRSKASASERHFEVLSRTLDGTATAGLMRKTVELNCSTNSVVLAAFLKAMAAHPHPRNVALQLATSGTNYPDLVLDRVFAGFAQCAPTDFEVPDAGARIDDVIASVHAKVHERLNSGFDRALAKVVAGQMKKVPLAGGVVSDPVRGSSADVQRANVHFSFLGQVRFGPAGKDADVTRIRTGGTNPAGSLECQFLIFDGRLMLFLVFDSAFFDAQLIERFLDRFAAELESCSLPPATSATPPPDTPSTPAGHTGKVGRQLLEIAAETMHLEIAPDQLALDLEADLGIDSLQRVRLAIHLYSRSLKTLDRDALLACRTLAQMASVIEEHYPDGFADS
ncbi:MAG: hypothetical protein AMXMBFR59_34400 [Rhodanobacteraceae bacterium]